MADQCQGDEFTIADFVHDETAEDNAETEAGESRATNGSELGSGEAIFFGPVVKNAATDGEADAGGEDGHESRP